MLLAQLLYMLQDNTVDKLIRHIRGDFLNKTREQADRISKTNWIIVQRMYHRLYEAQTRDFIFAEGLKSKEKYLAAISGSTEIKLDIDKIEE